jgi:membrane fusion protein (multidrug efflux system)
MNKQPNASVRGPHISAVPALLGLTLALGLLTSCFPKPPQEEVETVFAVNVIPAVKGELYDYIQVNGDVESLASVNVFANNNGEIISINVGLGQYVSAGQVIAKVDPSRPGQNFLPNPVRAPISGTITGLPVRVGSTITVQTPIAQIARTSELEIVTYIAERFIGRIKNGLDALVSFDAFGENSFKARIAEVSPVLDPGTRSLEVKLRFTEKANQVKAGMFAAIRIITQKNDGIIKIPATCIVNRFDQTFVFVVKNGNQVERREVVPGIQIDDKAEIVSGLNEGELVVIQGQNVLEDKAKVRIIQTLEPLSVQDMIK